MTIIPIVVACMIAVACLVGLFFVTKGLICLLRRNPRSGLAYIIVGTLLFVLVAIAIPSFVKARNTSAQEACLKNLRIIDAAKEQYAMAARLSTEDRNPSPITFPGSIAACTDPREQFTIECESEQSSTGDMQHSLYLCRRRQRDHFSAQINGIDPATNRTLIYTFGRSADVLWSPEGKHIALTDWAGSNVAEVWIIDVTNPSNRLSVADYVPDNMCRAFAGATHSYYEAQKWQSENELDFRIWGHGTNADGNFGFDKPFQLDLEKRMVKAR